MRIGRNDPCPCGSGQKYKKCHGAVIPLETPSAERRCGTCTACCDGWAVGTVYGYEMKPGTPCHFRGEGCCTIYERRPIEPCRNFVCAWLRPDSPFPDSFRPDRLGVMIVTTQWRQDPAYILVSAGRDPDEGLLAWMRELSSRTGAPFFYEQGGEALRFRAARFPAGDDGQGGARRTIVDEAALNGNGSPYRRKKDRIFVRGIQYSLKES